MYSPQQGLASSRPPDHGISAMLLQQTVLVGLLFLISARRQDNARSLRAYPISSAHQLREPLHDVIGGADANGVFKNASYGE